MKHQISPHKIVLILLIVAFVVVSSFDCFAIVGEYITDKDAFVAGDTFVKETRSNSLMIVLICSIVQVTNLLSGKKGGLVTGIVTSALLLLLTVAYAPLCNASKQIRGGIISYYYEVTWLGYIAIALSFVIFLLHIYSFRKQR